MTTEPEGDGMRGEALWKTDEHGRLLGVPVHDSSITELSCSNAGVLRFSLTSPQGGIVEFELLEVTEMNLLDISIGAVVADVYVMKICEVPLSYWQIPDSVWNALFSERLKINDAKNVIAKL